jgi:hypothetical protein
MDGDRSAMKRTSFRNRVQRIGTTVTFYVPKKKLTRRLVGPGNRRASEVISEFFLEHFGGFTHETSRIQGYWVGGRGQTISDTHERFEVAVRGRAQLGFLLEFLGRLCAQLKEDSIYTTYDGRTWLIMAEASDHHD